MDVLSQILDSIDMRGSLYFATEFSEPWSLEVPADTNVCRFHVVIQGACWLTVPKGDSAKGEQSTRLLSTGDLALVPHGNLHLLKDQPDRPTESLARALEEAGYEGEGSFCWGGTGAVTRMVCGYFAFDKEHAHPMLEGLPDIVHVQSTPNLDFGWIEPLTRFISQEASGSLPGSRAIANRLSEVLFIQAIRHYAAHSESAAPVLSGISDPQVGKALRAIHRDVAKSWTLQSLAREAALSRTAFTQRFSELVGMTATDYLTQHRMRLACSLLRQHGGTAWVAEQVGYQSEAAFSRRFKQHVGLGPGAYRRQSQGRASD